MTYIHRSTVSHFYFVTCPEGKFLEELKVDPFQRRLKPAIIDLEC